jgi:hypothetical protein
MIVCCLRNGRPGLAAVAAVAAAVAAACFSDLRRVSYGEQHDEMYFASWSGKTSIGHASTSAPPCDGRLPSASKLGPNDHARPLGWGMELCASGMPIGMSSADISFPPLTFATHSLLNDVANPLTAVAFPMRQSDNFRVSVGL